MSSDVTVKASDAVVEASNSSLSVADLDRPAARRANLARKIAISALLAGATLFVCLLMLEAGLRTTGRYKMGRVDGFLAAGGLSYVLQSNVTKTVIWPSHAFTVHTCDLGFRASEQGHRAYGERPYVAVLGSSEVFGNGLDYNETFVGVMAEHLEKRGMDVINMAMPGHHLLEQIEVYRRFASSSAAKPRAVMIVLNPLFIGGYDDIHEGTVVRRGELFPEKNWKKPLAKMLLANSSASYCYFRDVVRGFERKYSGGKDFSLSFYLQRHSTQHPIRSPAKTEDFLRHLRALDRDIRAAGSIPIYVYAPTTGGFYLNDLKKKGELDGNQFDTEFFPELAEKFCRAEGTQLINLEPLLQQLYDSGDPISFNGDAHFNGPTSRALGEYIFNELNAGSLRAGK